MLKFNINLKSLFLMSTLFMAIFLKYYSMWQYLFVGSFNISTLLSTFLVFFLILSLFKAKIPKNSIKNIIKLVFMGIIVLIIDPKIDFIIGILLAIVFAITEDGDRKFIKYYFINSLLLFCLTIVLYLIGILPANNLARVTSNGILTRYSFGFAGTNTLFLCLIPIFASFLIYKRQFVDKNRIKVSIILLLISIFLYKITLCRTGMVVAFILIVFVLFKDKIRDSSYEIFIKYSLIILLAISILLAINYSSFTKLDYLLSNRLYFWNKYVSQCTISLFDNSIIKGAPLDNVYLTYLYIDGIIITFFYFLINYCTGIHLKKNITISAMFCIFSIYGLCENNYSYQYNFILIIQMIYFLNIKKSQSLLNNIK